jgi:molybdopterin molybdotransferase
VSTLRVAEAQAAIHQQIRRQPSLRLPLADTIGHRLAEDVVAPWPLPMWTAASMDGYAVHGDDVRGASDHAPVTLALAGGGDAGDGEPPPLQRGTAWRVATGGRVPIGADSVVRQEDTEHAGRAARSEKRDAGAHRAAGANITIVNDRDVGRNVRPAGGDVAQGDVVLRAGTLVHPGVLAMLAALGEAAPMVYRKPRVAILTSGNEVVSLEQLEQISSGERIADVNGPLLSALVRQAGGVAVTLGPVADDPDAIRAAIASATDADLVITAGGISVGTMDHIVSVMELLSARIVFRRVALRPGGPTTFAMLPTGISWLALPGNPVSAFVTFHLFATPAIAAMTGDPALAPVLTTARLASAVSRDGSLDQYLRVTLRPADDGGTPWAHSTGNQGSWVLSSIVEADALASVEAGEGQISAASEVGVLMVKGEG